jgi:hypothetical protein
MQLRSLGQFLTILNQNTTHILTPFFEHLSDYDSTYLFSERKLGSSHYRPFPALYLNMVSKILKLTAAH